MGGQKRLIMPTKAITRSSSSTTAARSKAQIVGQTAGSSTGIKAGSSSSARRPLVLKRRDVNRQTRLTSKMQSSRSHPRAGPSSSGHASSSKLVVQGLGNNQVSARSAAAENDSSVIFISSDEEDDDILQHPAFRQMSPEAADINAGTKRKERENGKGKGKGPEDIIVARYKREVDELRKQREQFERDIHREKHTAIRLRVEREALRQRLCETEEKLKQKEEERRVPTSAPLHAAVSLSELDDFISCEICTTKMFYPATIRECGHTFCESCLHDWFNSTYTQHVAAHPAFLAGPQVPIHYHWNRHVPQVAEAIRRIYAGWRRHVPQPKYTCPTCRTRVENKPIEVYFVKGVVRKIADIVGNGNEDAGRSPKRLSRGVGGIWDGFFPEAHA